MDEMISQFDRLPPSSIDAEMALIGSMVIADPNDPMLSQINGLVSGDDMFSADHQIIFETINALRRSKVPVDVVTVCNDLSSRQLLEEIGGRSYIGKIFNTMPSAAHGEHYAKIVRGKARLRNGIAISNDLLRAAYSPHSVGEEDQILAAAASQLLEASIRGRENAVYRLGDVATALVRARNRPDGFDRLKTGMKQFDNLIGGLPIGGQTVVASKPGMGKSALAKQWALDISGSGLAVGIISIEESVAKIAANAVANFSGVPNNRIRFSRASKEEWDRADLALPEIVNRPVYVVDSALKISSIISCAELLVNRYRCGMIVVDHIHLIDAEPEKHQNREREISKVSGMLKMTWKRLNVAGVVCAQLNRGSGSERPTKENLRDSGTLEQDGDVIILLHREDYYRKQEAIKTNTPVELDGKLEGIIDKNKDGAVGTVDLLFDESFQLITDQSNDDPAYEYSNHF